MMSKFTMTILVASASLLLAMPVYAQQLSIKEKTFKVEEFPEYIVMNCDNTLALFERTLNIVIPASNSDYEKILKDLASLFDDKMNNHTDILNAMSKLGFDYVDAFPQVSNRGAFFDRTSFVFRKKEKYRN
jgi:hypothetical protein